MDREKNTDGKTKSNMHSKPKKVKLRGTSTVRHTNTEKEKDIQREK